MSFFRSFISIFFLLPTWMVDVVLSRSAVRFWVGLRAGLLGGSPGEGDSARPFFIVGLPLLRKDSMPFWDLASPSEHTEFCVGIVTATSLGPLDLIPDLSRVFADSCSCTISSLLFLSSSSRLAWKYEVLRLPYFLSRALWDFKILLIAASKTLPSLFS